MSFRVTVTVLFIAALGFGIVGCSTYNRYDDPYRFGCGTARTTMDDVLHAAVRHKCLPQVLTKTEVKCTSVKEPKNVVVIIKLDSEYATHVEIANIWESKFKKENESYNKILGKYNALSKRIKDDKDLTRDQKDTMKDKKKSLEKDLDYQLNQIKQLQKTHKFPTMEEYNDWVHAFGEEIQVQIKRRTHQD